MTLIPSVESYRRDAHEIEDLYGPLIPDVDELHDEQLARQDRLADHAPSPALAWMTPPVPVRPCPSPNPCASYLLLGGARDGEGPAT
jgi:hypothetical protein